MTGLIILARAGSSRLKGKHFLKAGNRAFIQWLIARFEHAFEQDILNNRIKIIVASSTEPGNEQFANYIADSSAELYRGDDKNIPLRILSCATQFNLSQVIVLTGDNILCSPHAARLVGDELSKKDVNKADVVGLPIGMNCGGFSVEYLKQCLHASNRQNLETGWENIFVSPKLSTISLGNYDLKGKLRVTIDYPEDAVFFRTIIENLGEAIISMNDASIIEHIVQNELYTINTHLTKEYWENYENDSTE